MKKIEDMLNNLTVPKIENEYHFSFLRSKLLHNFFTSQRQYILRYHWALSLAAVLFIALSITFIVPNFAEKVNAFVFGDVNEKLSSVAVNQSENNRIPIVHDNSITVKNSDQLFANDKTYFIRQYNSPRSGKVMLVSEYNKQPQSNKIRKTSASCY